jgi:hypothetical protein
MVPDLNRVIGRFNGRFGLLEKLRLLLMLRLTNRADNTRGHPGTELNNKCTSMQTACPN